MTQSPSRVRELLHRYGVDPAKSRGQHFLADPNVVDKIVRLVPGGRPVLEIGAGTGSLTAGLVGAGHRVLAYEIDERLRRLLDEVLGGRGVEVRYEDATKVDFRSVLSSQRWAMVSNLPYNVGTPLLMELLQKVAAIELFVVMVQREVGERLTAQPGGKQYGIPSVAAQLYGQPTLEFSVGPQLFIPPPAVDSVVVSIARPESVAPESKRAVELARSAFNQRRKMVRRSLKDQLSDLSVLARAGIDGDARPESLAPMDWVAIANAEAKS